MKNRGFALLISIIFMTVMLALGLSLGALGFKQMQLSSSAIGSQYAFYAADAGMECALHADQQQDLFNYETGPFTAITCDGVSAVSNSGPSHGSGVVTITQRLSLNAGAHCADVTIYKYADLSARFFSQGYDVPCSVVNTGSGRFVSRGIKSQY